MLFLLYINDLSSNVQDTEMVLFADDINVLVIDKDKEVVQQKINRMLKQHETWFKLNNFIINIKKKTSAMSFHFKKSRCDYRPQIYYNSNNILYSDKVKFLGLDITENLNWKNHIQVVCAKLSKTIFMIKVLKGVLSTNLLRSIYFGKFRSLLRYGIIFFGGVDVCVCVGDSLKVLKIQKRVYI
jgi:hypothetical protein